MPGVAGQVKVIFSADTASYTASVKAAKQQLGVFEQSATSAGKVARAQFQEARGAVMVLGEEIGVHLPRHVQAFIAKLPGVASAMSSAFSALAVIAIGKAVFEAGEKIYEFAKKNEEAAAKNAAAWKAISGPLRETNVELAIANSKLQDSIDELSKNPGDGMKTALLEVSDAAQKLADKLDADIQKMRELAKGSSMQSVTSLVTGKEPSDQLDRMINFLGKTFQSTTAEYEDVKDRAARAGDTQNYREQSQLEVNALQERLGPTFKSLQDYIRQETNLQGADPHGLDRSANIQKAKNAYDVITGAVLAVAQEADRAAGTIKERQLKGASGAGAGGASGALTINTAELFNQTAEEYSKNQDALKVFYSGLTNQKTAQWLAQFAATQTTSVAIPDEVRPSNLFPTNFAFPSAQQSKFAPFFDSLHTAADQFTNLNSVLSNFTLTTLNSFNETLIKILSTPENMLRGKHPWRQLGASTAESAGTAALKYAEGTGMKALGNLPGPIGKFFQGSQKPTGTDADPFHVIVKNMPVGGGDTSSGSMADSIFGSGDASGSGGLGNLLGGGGTGMGTALSSLFSTGGAAAADDASTMASVMSAAGGIPGFAEGGMVPSNVPSLVGENGAELFVPNTSGRIIPNGQFGGSPTVNVHVYGNDDPARTRAAVHSAMRAYLPHLQGMAVGAMRDNSRRIPLSKTRG